MAMFNDTTCINKVTGMGIEARVHKAIAKAKIPVKVFIGQGWEQDLMTQNQDEIEKLDFLFKTRPR
jgi:hypothetical protein